MIGFQYTKDVTTGQEQGTFVALKGTPVAGTPEAPAYTAGDCLGGAVSAFLPLYLVRLTGIAVESVTRHGQWQSLPPVSQANQTSAALASQLTQVQQQYAGLVLVPGDSIYVRNVFCAGGVTGGGKNLYFFIPLSRTPVGVTTVTLTNPDTANVTARKVSGGYIADGKTVGTMGTVTCDIRPNGVAVSIRSETVYDVVNNTPAVVEADKFNLAFA